MGRLALKYGMFINILLMEAWFCWTLWQNPESIGWEPAIVFLTSLGALIYLEFKDQSKSGSTDKKLFQDFLQVLTYEKSIAFIDSNNMAGIPFDPANHEDLRNFYYHWDDASHEFLNKGIEKRRKVLWELIEQYIISLDANTVPTDNGLHTVPPEWESEQSERFKEVVDNFHFIAGQIVVSHQEFVRYARQALRI